MQLMVCAVTPKLLLVTVVTVAISEQRRRQPGLKPYLHKLEASQLPGFLDKRQIESLGREMSRSIKTFWFSLQTKRAAVLQSVKSCVLIPGVWQLTDER